MTGPLTGVRVLELGSLIAGPFCAKTLGDFATNYGSGSPVTIGSGLASGASGYFTVSVQMASSAGNSLQGRSASTDFTWHLDQ